MHCRAVRFDRYGGPEVLKAPHGRGKVVLSNP